MEILCAWDGTVRAWLDQNENGLWEQEEPPLPGVRFMLHTEISSYPFEPTDWNGETYNYPHCTLSGREIIARVPPGYRLTTPGQLTVTNSDLFGAKSFGFAQLPGLPTATPRPPDPHCTPLSVPTGNDLLVTPDNVFWIATWDGAIRFDPATENWIQYTIEDGLPSNHVNAITVAADGSLWFGTDVGVTHYDGSSWLSYTKDDGLTGGRVTSLAAVDNGIIWAATANSGLSRFDPATGLWTHHYSREHGLTGPILKIAVAPDRSLWFTDKDTLSHLATPGDPVENLAWQTYPAPITIDAYPWGGNTIAVTAEGYVWIVGITQVARLNLQTGEWNTYNPPVEIPYLTLYPADASNLWLGTVDALVHFQPQLGANNPHAWRIYQKQFRINSTYITQIVPTADGVVWLGTMSNGLVRCQFEQ